MLKPSRQNQRISGYNVATGIVRTLGEKDMTSAERGRVFAVSQYKSVQVSKISKILKPLHAFFAQAMTLQCNTETRGISHVCETGVARKCMAFRANLRTRVDCFKQWSCKNKPEGSEGSEGLVSGVHCGFKWQYLCRGELDPFNSLQSQSCVSPCLYLYDSISCVYNILNM